MYINKLSHILNTQVAILAAQIRWREYQLVHFRIAPYFYLQDEHVRRILTHRYDCPYNIRSTWRSCKNSRKSIPRSVLAGYSKIHYENTRRKRSVSAATSECPFKLLIGSLLGVYFCSVSGLVPSRFRHRCFCPSFSPFTAKSLFSTNVLCQFIRVERNRA